jgi:DNA-binding IclR family transcriptional regulator
VNDEEIDELILNRLRRRRGQEPGDRTLSAADLATFFNEPESRIRDRLKALAEQGLVKESSAVPDRWMIVP